MSLNNLNLQAELGNQIDKRINHESPTKYDIDFYIRKVTRLENDLNQVQDELSRARVRLRRAEDYEIKYEMLHKQNSNLLQDLDQLEKHNLMLKSQESIIKNQLQDKYQIVSDFELDKNKWRIQAEEWKSKYQEVIEQQRNQTSRSQQTSSKKIKQEVQTIKRDFREQEDQYQEQIRQFKKTIHEKETVENIVRGKVEAVRQEKDEEIKRLAKILETRQVESLESLKEKNDEINKLREKFEKMFNFEIENLRKTLSGQDQLFSIENTGLRELLELKNGEINQLVAELKSKTDTHNQQSQQHFKETHALREKIYEIQRQSELELYNVKERLTKIHAQEIQTLEKRYTDLINDLKAQRNELENHVKETNKLAQAQKSDNERIRDQLYQRLKQRDARIQELESRIREIGQLNQHEIKTLHHSFHEIETDKQNQASQYEHNVGFLNQQLAKLTGINELKNKEIKELIQEIAQMKKNHGEVVRDLEEKWDEEKREREDERQKERVRRDKILQEHREKEKQWKYRERDLEREREKEQREKNKVKFINEELQKDVQRLNNCNKQLQENLKRELKKNQLSTLDTGGLRRELSSELERQKNECQAIKRMEVDQIRQKFQVEVTRLTNANEKLQTDLLNKELALEEVSAELKALEKTHKNIERINKQKLADYQRKMATLNNEINLTQNLYKSFLDCKARQEGA